MNIHNFYYFLCLFACLRTLVAYLIIDRETVQIGGQVYDEDYVRASEGFWSLIDVELFDIQRIDNYVDVYFYTTAPLLDFEFRMEDIINLGNFHINTHNTHTDNIFYLPNVVNSGVFTIWSSAVSNSTVLGLNLINRRGGEIAYMVENGYGEWLTSGNVENHSVISLKRVNYIGRGNLTHGMGCFILEESSFTLPELHKYVHSTLCLSYGNTIHSRFPLLEPMIIRGFGGVSNVIRVLVPDPETILVSYEDSQFLKIDGGEGFMYNFDIGPGYNKEYFITGQYDDNNIEVFYENAVTNLCPCYGDIEIPVNPPKEGSTEASTIEKETSSIQPSTTSEQNPTSSEQLETGTTLEADSSFYNSVTTGQEQSLDPPYWSSSGFVTTTPEEATGSLTLVPSDFPEEPSSEQEAPTRSNLVETQDSIQHSTQDYTQYSKEELYSTMQDSLSGSLQEQTFESSESSTGLSTEPSKETSTEPSIESSSESLSDSSSESSSELSSDSEQLSHTSQLYLTSSSTSDPSSEESYESSDFLTSTTEMSTDTIPGSSDLSKETYSTIQELTTSSNLFSTREYSSDTIQDWTSHSIYDSSFDPSTDLASESFSEQSSDVSSKTLLTLATNPTTESLLSESSDLVSHSPRTSTDPLLTLESVLPEDFSSTIHETPTGSNLFSTPGAILDPPSGVYSEYPPETFSENIPDSMLTERDSSESTTTSSFIIDPVTTSDPEYTTDPESVTYSESETKMEQASVSHGPESKLNLQDLVDTNSTRDPNMSPTSGPASNTQTSDAMEWSIQSTLKSKSITLDVFTTQGTEASSRIITVTETILTRITITVIPTETMHSRVTPIPGGSNVSSKKVETSDPSTLNYINDVVVVVSTITFITTKHVSEPNSETNAVFRTVTTTIDGVLTTVMETPFATIENPTGSPQTAVVTTGSIPEEEKLPIPAETSIMTINGFVTTIQPSAVQYTPHITAGQEEGGFQSGELFETIQTVPVTTEISGVSDVSATVDINSNGSDNVDGLLFCKIFLSILACLFVI